MPRASLRFLQADAGAAVGLGSGIAGRVIRGLQETRVWGCPWLRCRMGPQPVLLGVAVRVGVQGLALGRPKVTSVPLEVELETVQAFSMGHVAVSSLPRQSQTSYVMVFHPSLFRTRDVGLNIPRRQEKAQEILHSWRSWNWPHPSASKGQSQDSGASRWEPKSCSSLPAHWGNVLPFVT